MHTMTLPQEIVADKEKAKILEIRIYQLGKTTKLWKPKIKNIEELHAFVKRALQNRDIHHNLLFQSVAQIWRTAGSSDLQDMLELTTEYLELKDNIVIKNAILKSQPKDETPVQSPETQKPKYIIRLVDKGLLYPDGKRIINNLDTVACFLRDEGIQVTKRLLLECFQQPDGKPYSEAACKLAANKANAK
jgi:hypothetical protein